MLSGVDLVELRRLIRLVQRTGIGELEVSTGGRSVRISAHGPLSVPTLESELARGMAIGASPTGGSKSGPAAGSETDTRVAITSPMVGTFYRAPAPDADP